MRLKGKTAIITGAAQGIGAAFAEGFAKEGAEIVIADIMEGTDIVKQLEETGSEALYINTDVSKQDQCDRMARATIDRFGKIDILINNAAIFGSLELKPFTEISSEEFKQVMDVNTSGAFHCIKAAFPYMKDRGGRIINIASASILEGAPGMCHYVSSKGAIFALTRCLARELGDYKININSIAPGFTHSEGGDRIDRNKKMEMPSIEEVQLDSRCIKRPAVPEDLIGTALYLATEDSSFVTGQMIVHDGGLSFH